MVKLALGLLAFASFGTAKWSQHDYTPETSKTVADAIKAKLYPLPLFVDCPASVVSPTKLSPPNLKPI